MLKKPRLGGAAQLRLLVEEIGFDRACKAIDVHPNTMRRWLREATPVPQAPLQALYWLTSWGFSEACAEAHWSHQYLVGKVREMERLMQWRAPPGEAANDDHFERLHLVGATTKKARTWRAKPWELREG